jgi:hypothetical protein
MSSENWNFEDATTAVPTGNGVVGPVGNAKPLPTQDFALEPGKGNLGGPGNMVANAGAGVDEIVDELREEQGEL